MGSVALMRIGLITIPLASIPTILVVEMPTSIPITIFFISIFFCILFLQVQSYAKKKTLQNKTSFILQWSLIYCIFSLQDSHAAEEYQHGVAYQDADDTDGGSCLHHVSLLDESGRVGDGVWRG